MVISELLLPLTLTPFTSAFPGLIASKRKKTGKTEFQKVIVE